MSEKKLLSTDELLDDINASQTDSSVMINKQKKQHKYRYIFWSIVAIAVLHLVLIILPILLGTQYTIQITGSKRVLGIPFVEGSNVNRSGNIIVLHRYDLDNITVDDHVVVYGLQDTDYYWDVIITSFDRQTESIAVTYDGIYSLELTFDDIVGVYVKDANFFGALLYVFSGWRSVIGTSVLYGGIIYVFYILRLKDLRHMQEEDNDGEKETAT